jgi:hypothetical protein
LLQDPPVALSFFSIALRLNLLFPLQGRHPRLGAILFEHDAVRALNALQRAGHVIKLSGGRRL